MPPHLASLVAFLASAAALVLEIVAGRVLAPYLGVSLYTWTTVIGVVLAGLALGSLLGGWLADRWASPRLLALVLLAGGLASLLVLPLTALAAGPNELRLACQTGSLGPLGPLAEALCAPVVVVLSRILFLTAALFFLPACCLGAVTPLVVRLALRGLAGSGATVGSIYASATAGSLVGAFATGFWLISAFGTRLVVLGAGLLLVLLALALYVSGSGPLWRVRAPRDALPPLAGLAAVGLLLGQIADRRALESGCYRETDYFCIKIYDLGHERGGSLRVLELDRLVHSYNALDDPTYYEYAYVRIYAELTDYVARAAPDFRALFVGGGGYTLPRGLEVAYPHSQLEVVEIDPGVTRVAYERLGLPAASRVRTYSLDARLAVDDLLASQPPATPRYHLIYGDAFNDVSVPYHLTTLEFDQRLRALLRDDGLYLVNVIDRFRGGLFLPSMVRTLRQAFPHVYLLTAGTPWLSQASSPSTYVIAATATPLDPDRLAAVRPQGVAGRRFTSLVPPDVLETWLQSESGVLLTDDYAPADWLVAPLFLERGL
jgi:spermidine synthase/MFS family permease